MEGVAWFTHKYIMHGFLWVWHRSHHQAHDHLLERNDLFALVFSLPAMLCIVLGSELPGLRLLIPIGLGITSYGIFYFVFHDVIVHQRIKFRHRWKHSYMRRIIRAHYIHHEVHTKEGAQAFGFLYAPKKYAEKKERESA